ncbi:MAG TPA: SET domain-containing protein-lysine N-methyltransferase [Bacteroidia bacterium]|jgi:hypothetical protein
MKTVSTDINQIDAAESDYLFVEVSSLPSSGNGLLTAIDIFRGEIIAVFKGEVLSDLQAKLRMRKGKDQYFISMLNGKMMDSMNADCFAKYANDASGLSGSSFKNNSSIGLDGRNNICLIATRNIKTGEEIFCSYGKKYWRKHGRITP